MSLKSFSSCLSLPLLFYVLVPPCSLSSRFLRFHSITIPSFLSQLRSYCITSLRSVSRPVFPLCRSHDRSITFISSIKSIRNSFFPLLSTFIISQTIFISIIHVFALVVLLLSQILQSLGLIEFKSD